MENTRYIGSQDIHFQWRQAFHLRQQSPQWFQIDPPARTKISVSEQDISILVIIALTSAMLSTPYSCNLTRSKWSKKTKHPQTAPINMYLQKIKQDIISSARGPQWFCPVPAGETYFDLIHQFHCLYNAHNLPFCNLVSHLSRSMTTNFIITYPTMHVYDFRHISEL